MGSALQSVLDLVGEAVFIADAGGHLLAWNRAAEELTGRRGTDSVDGILGDFLSGLPDPDPSWIPPDGLPDATWTGGVVVHSVDGVQREAVVKRKIVGGHETPPVQVLVASRGVRKIEPGWRPLTDQVTGLPHRDIVSDHFTAERQVAERDGGRVAFIWLDVDHFKSINQLLGHKGGDLVLRGIGQALSSAMGDSGVLCRVVGNEFLAVISNVVKAVQVTEIIERFKASLGVGIAVNGEAFRTTVSIGVALYPDDGADFVDLARKADLAKEVARRGGPDRVMFHTEQMSRDLVERRDLERALAHAIDRDEISVCYQLQVDLHTGRIVGLEALARWTRPGRGEVPPDVFIPIAEASGLIVELGAKIFGLVCAQAHSWYGAGLAVPVSVNLSPVEIARGGADMKILEVMEQSGLPPELLAVEITESGLIDETSRTETTIANLRESSVSLIIDDFLTGYSNFAYLRRFRASELKIDRSFVTGIETHPENQAIVRAVVQMAATLGAVVLAEGVETEQEAAALRALGCQFAQGYLYARPLPAEEVEPLLTLGTISLSASRNI